MKDYLELFKALSEPTRLRIMMLLAEKELCVCQLEDALRLSQVKVSRHLNVLRHARLVESRRDGLWVYYSQAKPKNCLEKKVFLCFKKCLRKDTFCMADMTRMDRCVSQDMANKGSINVRNKNR